MGVAANQGANVAKEVTRSEEQPAQRDVVVYRPRKLANVRYDPAHNMITDLDTGDRLSISSGHAGGPGQYGFSNINSGLIAYGGFRDGGYYGTAYGGAIVYEIRTLRTEHATGAPTRARSEYDIARLAEMFRARADALLPDSSREVIVIDARPATPNVSNPKSDLPKEES